MVFVVELKLNGCFFAADPDSSAHQDTIRECKGLRGPAFFETMLYEVLAAGDVGATALPLLFCSVNEGGEERSCFGKNPPAVGEKYTCSSVCLLACSVSTRLNAKHSDEFGSHCIALCWAVLFVRVRTAGGRI